MVLAEPVINPLLTSVALIDCTPKDRKVTRTRSMSPLVKIALAGRFALGSLLVNRAVPA